MAQRLSREEFRRWAEGQTGCYERIYGEPIAMAPERIKHVRVKTRVWTALDPPGIAVDISELYPPLRQ